jgi:MerR family transcriptional regulator, light-induced transcriptional regulator
MLNRFGHKISNLVKMTNKEIDQQVIKSTEVQSNFSSTIDALQISMIEFDELRFEKLFSSAVIQYGFKDTIIFIIYPFLRKTGILWQTNTIIPAQEHFITNLIRQKLILAIEGQHIPRASFKKALLYLPEGEYHELALLFIHYLLKKSGCAVLYLGPNVPFDDLVSLSKSIQADYIVTYLTLAITYDLQEYLNKLHSIFPDKTILVSGPQVLNHEINTSGNIFLCKTIDSLLEFIDNLSSI